MVDKKDNGWPEHLKDQFSWSHANVSSPATTVAGPWNVSIESLKEVEVESDIRVLDKPLPVG